MQDESNAREDEQLTFVLSRVEQVAWAAGLFEGEGCWNAYKATNGTKMQVQMRLSMTDADVVERFAAIAGCGTVRYLKAKREREKPLTEWYTQRRSNVRALIELFKPFLGERRLAKAQEILALGESHPQNERTHCPKGHPYEGENLVLEPITRASRPYVSRRCKICRTEQARERARKRRGSLPERFRV